MATQEDLEFTYSQIDRLFRLSLGEMADFSGARFNGDFSITLEEAQRRKHEFVAHHLAVQPGMRVLDLGCGWGGLMTYLNNLGATTIGVTLSSKQAAACRRNGLDVRVMDCRDITRDTFGTFDGVASLGAFEHFCSPEEYRQGKQEARYRDIFEHVHQLLEPGARFMLQTMVFGPRLAPNQRFDVDAPRGSDAHVLGLLAKTFPGSWLPYGAEQVESSAAPFFRLVARESGRLDYIETIRRWRERFAEPTLRKSLVKLSLLPRYLASRDFRLAFASGISANTVCFERLLLDHFRFVFARATPAGPPDVPAATFSLSGRQ